MKRGAKTRIVNTFGGRKGIEERGREGGEREEGKRAKRGEGGGGEKRSKNRKNMPAFGRKTANQGSPFPKRNLFFSKDKTLAEKVNQG